MTIGRIIATTAVVCAAIGVTTQAEAAKRKSTGTMTFTGCAELSLVCGPVMRDIAGNTYTFIPPQRVQPGIPLKVVGRRSGDISIGWCKATRVQVISATPSGQSCGVTAR